MPELQTDAMTHEFVTEVLDESSWASVLSAIVAFLRERGVESITAEFGFVLARDLRGESKPENCTVPIDGLGALIQRGFQDGTIEWGGGSDFQFTPIGLPVRFSLCNDTDLHFASQDLTLLRDLSSRLSKHGIKIYDSGNLVDSYRPS